MTPNESDARGPADQLSQLRGRIDAVDASLIQLLAHRQELVEQVGVLKRGQPTSAVHAPARRQQIMAARREAASAAGLDPDVAEAIWTAMIDAFTSLELRVHAD